MSRLRSWWLRFVAFMSPPIDANDDPDDLMATYGDQEYSDPGPPAGAICYGTSRSIYWFNAGPPEVY